MIPWQVIDRAQSSDGTDVVLRRRGDTFVIHTRGTELMSSAQHGSEESLAQLTCAELADRPAPVVLIGGLGMGFTLRAALDLLPRQARVIVAELLPSVVAWNQGPLGPLAGHPLRDPRVQIEIADVGKVMRTLRGQCDAVLLDVDNGPGALVHAANDGLYSRRGLGLARSALRPGGYLAVWSATDDRRFQNRLQSCGFAVTLRRVRAGAHGASPRHTIYLGRKVQDAAVQATAEPARADRRSDTRSPARSSVRSGTRSAHGRGPQGGPAGKAAGKAAGRTRPAAPKTEARSSARRPGAPAPTPGGRRR